MVREQPSLDPNVLCDLIEWHTGRVVNQPKRPQANRVVEGGVRLQTFDDLGVGSSGAAGVFIRQRYSTWYKYIYLLMRDGRKALISRWRSASIGMSAFAEGTGACRPPSTGYTCPYRTRCVRYRSVR